MSSLRLNTKYSTKIHDFIYSDLGIINEFDEINSESKTLQMIIDAIEKTKQNNNYEIENESKIKSIHSRDQMPLLFLFFATLYDSDILSKIQMKNVSSNLTDFWESTRVYQKSG